MFRFNKINDSLYRYRDIDVKMRFDEDGNTSMLARIAVNSGESVQFYSHGRDFENVKQTIIDRIDEHLENHSDDRS